MDQLQLIFDMMGTPTKETWTRFRDLKLLRTGEVKIEKAKRPKLRERYQHKIPPLALSLIEKMLELDPSKRLTADRALQARYFLSEPRAPDRPEDLGTIKLEGGHFH
jgi:serine/threonine protein kinase